MEKTISFEFEKDTKGTFRYKEIIPEGGKLVVGTLYIRKDAFEDLTSRPDRLSVTIKEESEPQEESVPPY